MEEPYEGFTEDLMDDLILMGAIQVAGLDPETGEFLYNFTEKLEAIAPEVFNVVVDHFREKMMFFWENGFIDMDITIDNPTVTLRDKAFDPDELAKLTKNQRTMLSEIVSKMSDE